MYVHLTTMKNTCMHVHLTIIKNVHVYLTIMKNVHAESQTTRVLISSVSLEQIHM